MKDLKTLMILIAMFGFIACGGTKTKSDDSSDPKTEETENEDENSDVTKIYKIKSGHIIYNTTMDMTIETWFDDYGNKQYSVSTIEMFGEKSGTISIIVDGYKYDYSIGTTEGTKVSYYAAPTTDYSDVSDEDIEKYGIEKEGKETIAGKECDVFSIEEPMASKVWIWEGIPMKTVTKLGKEDFVMEITTIELVDVDASKFELPEGISFKEY
jgi:hypothetical protein